MTFPLQNTRAPRVLTLFALACALLIGQAIAQPDTELEAMSARAVDAAISGMNLANDGSSDIRYDGQSGTPGVKMGLLNPQYFKHLSDYNFVLKRPESPAAAIDSIFAGPTRLECNTMMIAIEYRAIKAAIGDERFERAFQRGSRRLVRIEIAAALERRVLGSWLESIPSPTEEDLVPGDWVYFKNHDDYLNKHPAGAWQGENALYVGDNSQGEKLYSGFGVHRVTAAEMNHELLRAYNAPRSADDEATARRYLAEAGDDKRLTWLQQNPIVWATTIDEALAIAEVGMDLSEDEFEWHLIQNDPGDVLIEIEWSPQGEVFEETVTLNDIPGLVQCLRLNMESLRDLGKPAPPPTPTITASTNAGPISGGLIHGLGSE